MNANQPPRRWAPIVKGKKTPRPQVTGWIELFLTASGRWTSVPGASRFVAGAKRPE